MFTCQTPSVCLAVWLVGTEGLLDALPGSAGAACAEQRMRRAAHRLLQAGPGRGGVGHRVCPVGRHAGHAVEPPSGWQGRAFLGPPAPHHHPFLLWIMDCLCMLKHGERIEMPMLSRCKGWWVGISLSPHFYGFDELFSMPKFSRCNMIVDFPRLTQSCHAMGRTKRYLHTLQKPTLCWAQ